MKDKSNNTPPPKPMGQKPKTLDEAWAMFNDRRFLHGHKENQRESFDAVLSGAFPAAPAEQVVVDAARYRFLRNIPDGKIGERHLSGVAVNDWAKNLDRKAVYNIWSMAPLFGEELDREIDEAISLTPAPAKREE